MRVLILRFDAPLVSFGGPAVDHHGVVQRFPALSMLTGVLANALGWCHREVMQLQRLQDRIRFAARIDRAGEALTDYQTVALGEPWMQAERAGWTTRGEIANRGGQFSEVTHIRLRHYRADSLHTLAVTLRHAEAPSVDDLATALREPARPLFLGRKCCLPALPVLQDVLDADSPLAALASVPRNPRGDAGPLAVTWCAADGGDGVATGRHTVAVTDERDWANRIHVGHRLLQGGFLDPPEARHV